MPRELGRRIVIYGWAGSGKTALARRLGEALELPVIELDALYWRRGNWQPSPPDEFRADVLAALASQPDGWVCDGNYAKIRDAILPMAEGIVWLRLPFHVTYWRLLKRTIRRAWTKEPYWGNNIESWRLSFLSKDSILVYAVKQWRRRFTALTEDIAAFAPDIPVVELRSTRAVADFLDRLNARASARPAPGCGGRRRRG